MTLPLDFSVLSFLSFIWWSLASYSWIFFSRYAFPVWMLYSFCFMSVIFSLVWSSSTCSPPPREVRHPGFAAGRSAVPLLCALLVAQVACWSPPPFPELSGFDWLKLPSCPWRFLSVFGFWVLAARALTAAYARPLPGFIALP
jgi:hypothetical protein